MAIYHLHVKVIGRSKGQNAVASAAYRRATALLDEQENKKWDFSKKAGVIHKEISLPSNAPSWLKDLVENYTKDPDLASEKLWNKVERSEKRIDAQLAREIEFALPIELDSAQSIQLAREFINDQFTIRGMAADWSVHWDAGNPHVHAMLTMRELTADGFGKKVTDWNSKALLIEWRTKWAEYANFHLQMHQHDVHIDHRSYQDQGIELIPSTHLGKAVSDMAARGIATDIMQEAHAIQQKNLSLIASKPSILLDKMTKQQSTFTQHHVSSELGRYINDQGKFKAHPALVSSEPNAYAGQDEVLATKQNAILTPEKLNELFSAIEKHEAVFNERDLAKALTAYTHHADAFAIAMNQVRSSPELISLGAGEDGRDRFTTSRMIGIENDVQLFADTLRERGHVSISAKQVQASLANYEKKTGKQLTSEQLAAVKHITRVNAISCMVGRAGTGKSFSLGAAKAVWEASGARVMGVALAGIATDGLVKDAGIDSRTIESFRCAIQEGNLQLHSKDVIVMDEAGMTDSESMHAVLEAVQAARAKLVLVGDPGQLQPVGPGASFRALLERIGFAEIQTVYRQKEEWQRNATMDFSTGKIEEGIQKYDQKGCVHLEKTANDAISKLVSNWDHARNKDPKTLKDYLVITHSNEDVKQLNLAIREQRIANAEISTGHAVKTEKGEIYVSQGDRILFLKNDKTLGVRNGRFAIIEAIVVGESGNVLEIQAKLDGDDRTIIRLNPNEYNKFTHGYAATIHKTQGITVSHAYVYVGKSGWNRNLAYVAMTRHRESCNLYASKGDYRTRQLLSKALSRFALKDSLLDYPLAFAHRRGISLPDLGAQSLVKKLTQKLVILKQTVADQIAQMQDPEGYWRKKQEQVQHIEKAENDQLRREDARQVAAYVDANRAFGMTWAALQTKMFALGMNELTYNTPESTLLMMTAEYKQFKQTSKLRDACAATIAVEPEKYDRALSYALIDRNKLTTQANMHASRQKIEQYQQLVLSSKTIHRDRFAATLVATIKSNYRAIKEANLNMSRIQQHANAHVRRQKLSTLSPEKRGDFYCVEKYQKLTRQIGEMGQHVKSLPPEKLQLFKERLSERNALAHHIYHHAEQFSAGLDFFQIGLATTLIGMDAPTEKAIKQAEARWFKLQDYAEKHSRVLQVTQYQAALSEGLSSNRFALSKEIVQEPRLYHPAVIDSGVSWKQLRIDAKNAQRQALFVEFNKEEKLFLRSITQYERSNRLVGKKWGRIFEKQKSGKSASLKEIENANYLIAKRDYLASSILEKKESIEMNALFENRDISNVLSFLKDHHRIDFSNVQKQAAKHHGRKADLLVWEDHYHDTKNALQTLIAQDSIDGVPQLNKLDSYLRWSNKCVDFNRLSKPIQKNRPLYRYVMTSHGLSDHDFDRKINSPKEIAALIETLSFKQQAINDQPMDEERLKKVARAKQIESGTKAITGTLAERYLREHRAINGSIPNTYRYHPGVYHHEAKAKLPALVVIAKDEKHQTRAVQVIYLNAKTANKAAVQTPKLTFGVLSHGVMGVLVNRGKNSHLVAVAEGPETALSIREARPDLTIYAVLGTSNYSRAPISSETKHILFCADNDGEQAPSSLRLGKSADYYAAKNIAVWKAMPEKQHEDFNDVLKQYGKDAVKHYLDNTQQIRKPDSSDIIKLQTTHLMSDLVGKNIHVPVNLTLKDLIFAYIDCEIDQTRFVTEKHTNLITNPTLAKELSSAVLTNNKKKDAISYGIINHPDSQETITLIKQVKPLDIGKMGGFAELRKSLSSHGNSEITSQLVAYIYRKTRSKLQSKKEHRSRTK